MKKSTYLFITFLILLGCSSSSKLYENGEYRKAYSKALKNLKKGKKDRNDIKVLNNSYNQILKENLGEIESLQRGREIESSVEAYDIYDEIIMRYDGGKQYLDSDFKADIDSYITDRDLLGDEIYTRFKDRGTDNLSRSLANGNKLLTQEAYYDLEATYHFSEGELDEELDSLLNVALERGVITYNVVLDRFTFSNTWEIDREFSQIENRRDDIFRRFYYKRDLEETDCYIEIDFDDLEKRDRDSWSDQEFSEEIQDGYTEVIDTSGNTSQVPNYITVSATVRTYEVRREWEWEADIRLISSQNYCDLNVRDIEAQLIENVESYEISGDTRAVPSRYQGRQRVNEFMSENEVVEILIEELYEEFEDIFR